MAPIKKTVFLNTASSTKLLHRIESVNCHRLDKKWSKNQGITPLTHQERKKRRSNFIWPPFYL